MKKIVAVLLLVSWILFGFSTTQGNEKRIEQINIMLILDASSYSAQQWHGNTKFSHIRSALQHAFAELNKTPSWGLNLGMRIFGDSTIREKNNCVDYRLAAKLDWFEPTLLNHVIEPVAPKGKNCFAYGIASSKDDFPVAMSQLRNYLVCIISARDECTKDELISLQHLIKEARLEAVYIIGVNLSKADQEYFQSFYNSIPGELINTTSPELLKQVAVKILAEKCHRGSEPLTPDSGATESLQDKN
jgi:hypothetical protein